MPDSVLLILAPSDDGRVAQMRETCSGSGWLYRVVTSPDRMAWATTVLRPAAVLIVDGGRDWNSAVIGTVRRLTGSPVVILGAPSTERALAALRRGVDAIIPPGLSSEETLARIYAMIRCASEVLAPTTRYLDAGKVRLDLWQTVMLLDGETVHLTTIEFRLLALLMRNGGTTLQPAHVVEQVWKQAQGSGGENALRIAIRRLREKLNDDARSPQVIETVRGRGYRFLQRVVEVPDEARSANSRYEQVELLSSLGSLATEMISLSDGTLETRLVDHFVISDFAEAAAVHVFNGDRMVLRAHRGLSTAWAEAARELRLDDGYATGRAVSGGKPIHVASNSKNYLLTRAALATEGPGTCLFLPIEAQGAVRACVGVVRRSPREFDVASLAYLRAVLATFTAIWFRAEKGT